MLETFTKQTLVVGDNDGIHLANHQ